eukprot:TRINITY_DN654_c1_g1_i1.p1 TRINITY_DN654_c1_g1~~TRINITY_DN654_c1_g1_i1.p1  ORF type:complete len:386 (+),score=21.83 TRINITY_DN654_c1_g1_i1:275-1432(+)
MEPESSRSCHVRSRPEDLAQEVLLDVSRSDSIESLPDTPAELLALKKKFHQPSWIDRLLSQWDKIARSSHRAYLGVGLAMFGTCCGGLVFPLMDMYEEPSILKVGTRNLVLTILFLSALHQQERLGIHQLGDLNQIKRILNNEHNRSHLLTSLMLAGLTHSVVSIVAQFALDCAGDEVTAVLTNCSCLFAVVFSKVQGTRVMDPIVSYALYAAFAIILYFIIVIRPSVWGVVAGLSVSCVNAAHLIFMKTMRTHISIVPLMGAVYAISTGCLFLTSFYMYPEFGATTWLSAMLNPWYALPTLVVAVLTACFQGSIILALSFSTPIVVTGIMSFEPMATLAFDFVLGRPVPNTHTLLVLSSFIACTAAISIFNGGLKKSRLAESPK